MGCGMAKKLFKIVLNGVVTWAENAYIAKRGDKAWAVAWRIAENKGCIAPHSIEVLDIQGDEPVITIEDREDKFQSECECILFTNTYCDLFPDFNDNKKDQGFQFIYKGDSFSFG